MSTTQRMVEMMIAHTAIFLHIFSFFLSLLTVYYAMQCSNVLYGKQDSCTLL